MGTDHNDFLIGEQEKPLINYFGFDLTEEEFNFIDSLVIQLREKFSDEISSKLMRCTYAHFPKYSLKGSKGGDVDPHQGYIYLIRDPFIEGPKNIIYVGSSQEPHKAVKQHVNNSPNKRMRMYMRKLKIQHSDKVLAVRGVEVIDLWEDRLEDTFIAPEGIIIIPWEILTYSEPQSLRPQQRQVEQVDLIWLNSPREFYTEKFRSEGHPILNGKSGRPKAPQEDG